MSKMYHYASVSKALEDLKEKGFTVDFNIYDQDLIQNPSHYEIQHIYRYEGESNPDDEATVYGILSTTGQKGVFVAGYAANSDNDAAKVLLDLTIKDRNS
ncbi:hypothetical protein FVB9288_01090 [Flavobacterium sp. CECT 9288]|uniref:hypothetical protein n=1 Tax=Flavobacterium sp. CECT 9288 TaxID=2845819 RepID=UPI001E4A3B8A|nr:hypothetical protein [Flavobacterium sp. CECT 9288]CAH0335446.1 hypothetical protein FVB9288_01090 [Flavobacterium sp. CECT 9288]